MTESRLRNLIKNRNVAFITVKNKEYIRTAQIAQMLEQEAGNYKIYTSEKNSPATRAIDIRRRLKNISFEDVDVVILGFLPQLIIDAVSKKIPEGTVVVAEMFLSLYDTVVLDRQLVRKDGIISGICRRLDEKTVEKADLVVTDTKADATFFSSEFGKNTTKFETLYLEAQELPLPAESSLFPKTSKTVLYFGTGLPLQGTNYVIQAFRELTEKYGYKCIYIGGRRSMTRQNADYLKKGSITYIEWLTKDKLFEIIMQADICLAGHFDPNIDKADRTIPGKAYIYEKAGKPMILGDTTANHELFSSDNRHIFVKRGDFKKIVEAVIALSEKI